jgi:hypothetical protein
MGASAMIIGSDFYKWCQVFGIPTDVPSTGPVLSVDGITPDSSGNVFLTTDPIPQGANNFFLTNDGGATDNLSAMPTIISLQSQINGKLDLSGGTMTGALTLNADPSTNLEATTKQYTDSGLSTKLNLTGGTLTGFLTLNADPTINLQAATKQYVDSLSSSFTLQDAYNNDPNSPAGQIVLASGGEFDIFFGTDTPFAAIYNKGILSTLGLRILPSDNTEALNVLITTDTASTFAEMVSSSRGVVAFPAMSTTQRNAIPLTSAPFGLGISNTDYSSIDFYDANVWQTFLTIENLEGGTNITLDKTIPGKVKINASGGGSVTPAEYASFSIQSNPGNTTFAAANTFYPIVLGGTFFGNDSSDFTNQFMTISGISTPVMTCGSSVTQFYNVNINLALKGTTPIASAYIANIYIRQAGGTLVDTQYSSSLTLNDMVNYLDLSLTGNVQLSNGDSVFVEIKNLTNTNSVLAGYATFSIVSMSGSASTVANADNVGTTVNSSNASFYLPFVASSSSGYQPLNINSGINYNPSTNTLSANVFAGTATNAQNVLTNSAFTNLTFYPTFVASSGGGLQAIRFNSTLNFNPVSGVLTSPNLVLGALSANQLIGLNSGNIAASIGAGTSTQVLHGNASGLPTWSAVVLTTDVSGTLPFGNGGLGFSTTTTGDLFAATATNTPGTLAAVASGSVLASQGVGTLPAWSSSPTLTGLNLSGLTASQAVVTDSSKNLASLGYGSTNTANTLVERDSSGNFSAGTITAALSGNASTATTATNAQNVGTLLTTTNSTFFVPFVTSNATTNQPIEIGSLLTINPSTGLLTSTSLTLAAAGNLNLGNNVANILTINSATGANNRADMALNRFDSTNGNCRFIHETAGTPQWSNGLRGGSTNYTIFDEINSLAQVTVSLGSGTSGVVNIAGGLIVGQPGQFSVQLANGAAIAAKNSGGTLRTWCYPRFTDDKTYMDIGAAGAVFRQDNAGTTWMTVDSSGNVNFAQGNVEAAHNLSINGAGSFGGGSGVISIINATTTPTSNPTGGGILYTTAGALHYLGSSGTNTTVGVAEPHCPDCGSDFGWEWENEKYGGNLRICAICLTKELGERSYIRWNESKHRSH